MQAPWGDGDEALRNLCGGLQGVRGGLPGADRTSLRVAAKRCYRVGPKRSTRILFAGMPESVRSSVAASAKPGDPHTYTVASGAIGAGRSPRLRRPTGRGHDGGAARV